MDQSTPDIAHPPKRLIEWPTLGLVALCYGSWFLAGFYVYPAYPIIALALFAVSIALHSSLQHEIMHGHPTRNRHINEFLVILPLGLFFPYRRYKTLHLRHHADERLTDPYDDPESFYRSVADWGRLPRFLKTLLTWNNSLIGRMTIGPPLTVVGFTLSEIKAFSSDPSLRFAWMQHAIGLVSVVLLLQVFFGVPVWLYALTSVYLAMSILAIRSYCEHQWSERPDGRTIIVENSPLSLLFLNNNLHLVHHKMPTAAWYLLPAIYAQKRDEWQALNSGYVFRNYFQIFKVYAISPKEPVAHPALQLDPPGTSISNRYGLGVQHVAAALLPTRSAVE
ncbi:MAG: fatty acid desaturase [Allorhizobium sp.]